MRAEEYGVYFGVSIRSPHRSEGRRISHRSRIHCTRVSIRSPHRSEGRRGQVGTGPGDLGQVSIRSPHRSEGRRAAVEDSADTDAFQSAPPTGVRGDEQSGARRLLRHLRFNPLPPPE